jgi:hypothetical protein
LKPDMFGIWLFASSLRRSSFCASRKNMGRWFGSEVTCCPNCLQPDEDAAYLLQMNRSHTHPLWAHAVACYIFDRRAVKFQDIPGLPLELRKLAEEQDLIFDWLG